MAGIEEVKRAIAEEVAKLREVAATSVDASLVAQAIAVSDERVQELLASRISEGQMFKGMRASSMQEGLQLISQFQAKGQSQVAPGFSVIVNVSESRVLRLLDPSLSQTHHVEPREGAVPFTLAVPSNALNVFTSTSQVEAAKRREEAYFTDLGITPSSTSSKISYDAVQSNKDTATYASTGTPQHPDFVVSDMRVDSTVDLLPGDFLPG